MKNENIYIGIGVIVMLIGVYLLMYFAFFAENRGSINQKMDQNIAQESKSDDLKVLYKDGQKIIEKYYQLIQNKKFKEAYTMISSTVNFEEFKSDYEDAGNVIVGGITFDEKNHIFHVDIYHNEGMYDAVKHTISAKISGNSIEILNSQKHLDINEDLVVYVKRINENVAVVLLKDGQEIIIDKNRDDFLDFDNVKIIDGGQYLTFKHGGIYGGGQAVYDIKNDKLKKLLFSGLSFIPEQKIAYSCSGIMLEYSGTVPGGAVYDMLNLNQIYELSQDIPEANEFNEKIKYDELYHCQWDDNDCVSELSCKHDKINNVIIFKGYNFKKELLKEVVYNIQDGTISIK